MSERPITFVIMPFDPEFQPIFEQLIKPALEDAGYEVKRADSFLNQQNILQDIVRGIANADLIVAELTTLNPNVLYELGLCHGLGIPTIMLAQSMEEIPFDLRSYRILIYSIQFDQVGVLKESLQEIGERHIKQEIQFGSPVIDFIPTREKRKIIRSGRAQEKDGVAPEGLLETEDEEDGGFLDFMVEGIEATEEMNGYMQAITEQTQNIGSKFSSHSEKIKSITTNPGPGAASQARSIAIRTAKDIDEYSDTLDELLPKYERSVDHFIENFTGYIKWLKPEPKNKEQFLEFRNSIASLRDGSVNGLNGTRSFRDSIKGLKGISRDVNRSSRRLLQILEKVIATIEKVEAFCSKSLVLMDEKLINVETLDSKDVSE